MHNVRALYVIHHGTGLYSYGACHIPGHATEYESQRNISCRMIYPYTEYQKIPGYHGLAHGPTVYLPLAKDIKQSRP